MNNTSFFQPIYLVDHLNTVFRMFYGMPQNLTDKNGNPTQAIFGYTKLLKTLEEHSLSNYGMQPAIIICNDSKWPTIRSELYDKYKATRPDSSERPDDFYRQKKVIEEFFIKSGITFMSMDKYEADDIIATIVKDYSAKWHDIYIISSDKDLSQLITNYHTFILDGIKKITWHKNNIQSRFNVPADKIADYLALVWDKSDNIPGVSWIGKVWAEAIINTMWGIDEIYDILDNNEAKLQEILNKKLVSKWNCMKLLNGRDAAFFSKKLIELYNVPLQLQGLNEYVFSTADLDKQTLTELNISSIK